MDNRIFLYLAALISGFALSMLPASPGSLFEGIRALLSKIGILVECVFALVIIYLAFKSLFNKVV